MHFKNRYSGASILLLILGACGGSGSNQEDAAKYEQPMAAGQRSADTAGNSAPNGGESSTTGGQTSSMDETPSMNGGEIGTEQPSEAPNAGASSMGGSQADNEPVSSSSPVPSMGMGVPVDAQSEQLSDIGFIRFTQLSDGRIIGQTENGISMLQSDEREELGLSFGEFISAARIEDMVMVLTSLGLYVWTNDGLESSPLADAIPPVTALTTHPNNALWLATENGLYRWANGAVRRLMSEGGQLDWGRVQLSPGRIYGVPVVWVVQGPTVIAFGVSDGAPQAWSFELTESAGDITTTSEGLWVAGENTLSLLSDTGEWTVWQKPNDAVVIAGNAAAKDLWLSDGQNLWQWRNNELRARINPPVHTSLKVTDEGAALVSNLTGLYTVVSGRFVTVDGLDRRVTDDITITVKPSESELVESVSASLDGQESMAITGPPWELELTLEAIGSGNHTFLVDVRYTDGQQAGTTIEFLGPPSWTEDIDPLQQTHCARCHGQGGSAHLMTDAATWKLEIAEIIDDVETGRMPLNGSTLSIDEIELIRAWQDAGFWE